MRPFYSRKRSTASINFLSKVFKNQEPSSEGLKISTQALLTSRFQTQKVHSQHFQNCGTPQEFLAHPCKTQSVGHLSGFQLTLHGFSGTPQGHGRIIPNLRINRPSLNTSQTRRHRQVLHDSQTSAQNLAPHKSGSFILSFKSKKVRQQSNCYQK